MNAKRRYVHRSNRSRKAQLGWVGSTFTNVPTDESTVSAIQLVGPADFVVSPAGQSFVNVKRIVGEVAFNLGPNFFSGAAAAAAGAVAWAIFIQDLSDAAVLSPDSSTNLSDETVLAHGVLPINARGPGSAQIDYGGYLPPVRFDVRSNRRVTELQECYFCATVFTSSLNLSGEDAVAMSGAIRALITTSIKTT